MDGDLNGDKSDIFITKLYTDVKVDDENGNDTIGLAEVTKNAFGIYPNPASDVIYVDLDKSFDATIYNYQGQIVKKLNVEDRQINVSELRSGMYLVEIRTENDVIIRKVLIQ